MYVLLLLFLLLLFYSCAWILVTKSSVSLSRWCLHFAAFFYTSAVTNQTHNGSNASNSNAICTHFLGIWNFHKATITEVIGIKNPLAVSGNTILSSSLFISRLLRFFYLSLFFKLIKVRVNHLHLRKVPAASKSEATVESFVWKTSWHNTHISFLLITWNLIECFEMQCRIMIGAMFMIGDFSITKRNHIDFFQCHSELWPTQVLRALMIMHNCTLNIWC